MKTLFTFLMCFIGWLITASPAHAAAIKNIRLANYQTNVVRLVVELNEKTDAKVFRLGKPSRLVVDFKNTYFDGKAPSKIKPVNFISSVRRGVPNMKTARLVLELPNETLTEKHFFLPPSKASKNWRFVMDLTRTAKTTATKPAAQTAKTTATKSTAQTVTTTTVRKGKPSELKPAPNPSVGLTPIRKTKKIIVLDPGHGGKDPGAISKSGKYEKNLTLAMAKETKPLLEAAGYKVVLTRDRDIALALRRRVEIAHEADADLFISIHADSAKNSSARGLSVYTISERASDKEAAALAERENKADILLGLDLTGYNPDVSNILIDLAKIDTMNNSAIYAKKLVKHMKQEVKLVPNAHRFAGFAVLKSANVPSVLLEMGYLSNRQEERLLQKQSYRRDLARALVRAVNEYFDEVQN